MTKDDKKVICVTCFELKALSASYYYYFKVIKDNRMGVSPHSQSPHFNLHPKFPEGFLDSEALGNCPWYERLLALLLFNPALGVKRVYPKHLA